MELYIWYVIENLIQSSLKPKERLSLGFGSDPNDAYIIWGIGKVNFICIFYKSM